MAVAPGRPVVVLDTSVLINFLRIDRMDLIAGLPLRFAITEHVSAEVLDLYAEERIRLEAALLTDALEQHDVTAPAALSIFRTLMHTRRLGAGECAAIAYAAAEGFALAIEDRRAEKEAETFIAKSEMFRTADLVVLAVREGLLSVPEADAVKDDWAQQHRFRLKITSFEELL